MTICAIIIGGNLFGVIGMLFFIPLVSVVYALIRDETNQREAMKGMGTKKRMNT